MSGIKKVVLILCMVLVPLAVVSCAPNTFVKTMEPSWASVEVREGISFEDTWNRCIDILIRQFDMEMLSKEDGYARTTWLYTWTGQLEGNYRVRVTIKFTPDKKIVNVKSEAEYGGYGYGWVRGYDTRLLETIKTDVMGSIGRVTR